MSGRTSSAGGRSGSALLVVLAMLGVIAILAAAVARSVSSAALELSAARASARDESDLRAGIELGVAAILKLGEQVRIADAAIDLPGRRITVRATDERARIDLNRAKPEMMVGLLKGEGLDDNEAAALAANIVEWRGGATKKQTGQPQDEHRFGGALQTMSFDAPTGLASRQAPKEMPTLRFFAHPVQLVSVPGFSKALVTRLFPLLTVANGSEKINPFIAGPQVLNALPGTSSGKVEGFIDARDGNVGRETAIQLLGVDKELLSEDRAKGWRLQITSTPQTGRPRYSEAVVAGVDGASDEPYRVLYVLDNTDQYAWQARN